MTLKLCLQSFITVAVPVVFKYMNTLFNIVFIIIKLYSAFIIFIPAECYCILDHLDFCGFFVAH